MKLFLIVALAVILIGTFAFYLYPKQEEQTQLSFTPEHYKSLVILGLAPSTESRPLNQYDYDTGLRISHQGNVYALIESRGLTKSDFGETFVVRA